LCAGLIGLMLALGAARAQASPFVLDSAHTSAHFAASHFDRTLVRGRFIGITGQLDFDPVLHSGTLDVNIDPDTVDTGLRGLDTVLKSAQFFDTKEYPIVRFQSTQFTFEGGRLHTIAGQLTLHGVTLPVQLQADRFSCGEVKLLVLRRHVCGGDFHVTILRSAFGLRSFLPDVSDAVRIDIAAEASPSN
jgi:polyisoprenoid-binding protein YceI